MTENYRWIVLHKTDVDGVVPFSWECQDGVPDVPATYATEREAKIEIAEAIRDKMDQFIDDEKEEDLDLCEDTWVEQCIVSSNGDIKSDGFRYTTTDRRRTI